MTNVRFYYEPSKGLLIFVASLSGFGYVGLLAVFPTNMWVYTLPFGLAFALATLAAFLYYRWRCSEWVEFTQDHICHGFGDTVSNRFPLSGCVITQERNTEGDISYRVSCQGESFTIRKDTANPEQLSEIIDGLLTQQQNRTTRFLP